MIEKGTKCLICGDEIQNTHAYAVRHTSDEETLVGYICNDCASREGLEPVETYQV